MSHAVIRSGTNADATHKPALNLVVDSVIECSPLTQLSLCIWNRPQHSLHGVSSKKKSVGPDKRGNRKSGWRRLSGASQRSESVFGFSGRVDHEPRSSILLG